MLCNMTWKFFEISLKCCLSTCHCEDDYILSGRIGKVVDSHAEGCKIESRLFLSCADLYYARSTQGVLHMRVRGSTRELDLLSLTPLSVAGCG